jgi:hypothetical protein
MQQKLSFLAVLSFCVTWHKKFRNQWPIWASDDNFVLPWIVPGVFIWNWLKKARDEGKQCHATDAVFFFLLPDHAGSLEMPTKNEETCQCMQFVFRKDCISLSLTTTHGGTPLTPCIHARKSGWCCGDHHRHDECLRRTSYQTSCCKFEPQRASAGVMQPPLYV